MSQTPSRSSRHKKSKPAIGKWIAIAVCSLFVGVIFYYGYSIVKFGNDISEPNESRFGQFNTGDVSAKPADDPPKWEGTERVNILLLGGDDRGLRENEVPRSDTMLIASIDPVTKKAHLMSLLRDTYVDIPGYRSNRINAALMLGGPDLAMQTVSELLDIPIQYYVYVDFQGFIALIDAIGGIEYYVEKDMYYTTRADGPEYDINLKEGLQVLDGNKALQYVRFRYDTRGDYARTERQRDFITAVVKEMQTSSSIIRLPQILEKIQPYIETNMTLTDMVKLGSLAFDIRNETIHSLQVPPDHLLWEQNINGMDVVTTDKTQLQQYIQEAFEKAERADDESDDEQVEPAEASSQAEAG